MDNFTGITQDQKSALLAAIKEFSKDSDVIAIVKNIENSPQTTQDHYGRYLGLLSEQTKQPQRLILSSALLGAGANKAGIDSALKVIGDPVNWLTLV